jgi:hypothetical protein
MQALMNETPAPAWLGAPEAGEAWQDRRGRPVSSLQPLLLRRYTEDYVAAGRVLAQLLALSTERSAGNA